MGNFINIFGFNYHPTMKPKNYASTFSKKTYLKVGIYTTLVVYNLYVSYLKVHSWNHFHFSITYNNLKTIPFEKKSFK